MFRLLNSTRLFPCRNLVSVKQFQSLIKSPLSNQSIRFFGGAFDPTHISSDYVPRDEVEKRVLTVLSNINKVDKSKLNSTSAFSSLGLDSLDTVEVIIQIEEEFGIDLHDEQASNILTVKQAIDIIQNFPFALKTPSAHH
jgi:acyl carrier protein